MYRNHCYYAYIGMTLHDRLYFAGALPLDLTEAPMWTRLTTGVTFQPAKNTGNVREIKAMLQEGEVNM